MKKKILDNLHKIVLIEIIIYYVLSIVRILNNDTDEVTRNINLWTYALATNAAVTALGSFIVAERFMVEEFGKKLEVSKAILGGDESQSRYILDNSGLIVNSFAISIFLLLSMLVKNQMFLSTLDIALRVALIVNAVCYFSEWLKVRVDDSGDELSKVLMRVSWPIIFFVIQLLVVKKSVVGYFYETIFMPQDYLKVTMVLIVVLIYFTIIASCHYSNIYFMIGFTIRSRHVLRIEGMIKDVEELPNKKCELLVKKLEHIEQQKNVNIVLWLAVALKSTVAKYFYDRFYNALYLVLRVIYKIIKSASKLLEPEKIRANLMRFFAGTVVVELLAMNIILPGHFGDNHLCTKIFNLLSTLVVIPVLLSWIHGLKDSKKRHGSE